MCVHVGVVCLLPILRVQVQKSTLNSQHNMFLTRMCVCVCVCVCVWLVCRCGDLFGRWGGWDVVIPPPAAAGYLQISVFRAHPGGEWWWCVFAMLSLENMATDLSAHKRCVSVCFCVALHGIHGHRSVRSQVMCVGTLLCGFAWNTWPQICAHTKHACRYAFVWLCMENMATDLCTHKKCVLVRFCVALHGIHGHRSVRTQDMCVGTLLCGFAWNTWPQICAHTRNACWYAFVWLCMENMATDLCAHKTCMSVRFCVALHGKNGHRSVCTQEMRVGTLLCGFAWNTWPQICAHTRNACRYAFVWLCMENMATDLYQCTI